MSVSSNLQLLRRLLPRRRPPLHRRLPPSPLQPSQVYKLVNYTSEYMQYSIGYIHRQDRCFPDSAGMMLFAVALAVPPFSRRYASMPVRGRTLFLCCCGRPVCLLTRAALRQHPRGWQVARLEVSHATPRVTISTACTVPALSYETRSWAQPGFIM